MADEKQPQFKTTLGLSMQRFGRSLMRHYKPAPMHNATPAPSSDAGVEVQATQPYQQMSTSEINWDGVIAAKRNAGAPPALDQAEDTGQQGFVMRPRPAQPQRQQPIQRQPAQNQARPPARQQQRRSAPKKSDADSRLKAILAGHQAKEATRDDVRIQRRQAWEEAQKKGVDDSVQPAIPGWKPKPRASFDYVETSALIKDDNEKPPKLTDSIAAPEPVQRKEEPKRKAKSNIVEMRDGEVPDVPAPKRETPALNMGDAFADTAPMKPVDHVTAASEPAVQREVSDDATVEDTELGEFDLDWDAPLDDEGDFDDSAFDPMEAINGMNQPQAEILSPAVDASPIQRTPDPDSPTPAVDANPIQRKADTSTPQAKRSSSQKQPRRTSASPEIQPPQAPAPNDRPASQSQPIQRQSAPSEAAEASSNDSDSWDDDESDFADVGFGGLDAPVQRQAEFAPVENDVLWDDEEPEFYPPAYDDGDDIDEIGQVAASSPEAPQASIQRQAMDSQDAPQASIQRQADSQEASVQRRNRRRNSGEQGSQEQSEQNSRKRNSGRSDAVAPIQRNIDEAPVFEAGDAPAMADYDDWQDNGEDVRDAGELFAAPEPSAPSAPVIQRTMNADGSFDYQEVSQVDSVPQQTGQGGDLAAALGAAGMLNTADETYDAGDTGEATLSQASQPVVQRYVDESGNSHYSDASADIPSLPIQPVNLAEALQAAGIVAPSDSGSSEGSIQREAEDFNPGDMPAEMRDAMLQRMRDKSMEGMSQLRQQQEAISEPSQADDDSMLQRSNIEIGSHRKPRVAIGSHRNNASGAASSGASVAASASGNTSASMSASASVSAMNEASETEEEDLEKLTHDVYRRLRRRLRDEVDKYNRK